MFPLFFFFLILWVYVFFPGGSLQAVISENTKSGDHFQEPTLRDMLLQISVGLKYIHSSGMVHLDIKPSEPGAFCSSCCIWSFHIIHPNACLLAKQVSKTEYASRNPCFSICIPSEKSSSRIIIIFPLNSGDREGKSSFFGDAKLREWMLKFTT